MNELNLSRYWMQGSIELVIPLPRRSVVFEFIRNGRMIGLVFGIGRFHFSPSLYRPPWDD